jgi:hypothetical protein
MIVRQRSIVAAMCVCLAYGAAPYAQARKALESEVKAVYLLNFGRFATWPSSAGSSSDVFSLCVLGPDPFGPTLEAAVAGEAIDGKSVVVKRIAKPEDTGPCRVLFVSPSADKQLAHILHVVENAAVLTVSDMPEFASRGGMIQLVSVNTRVRFEVNLPAVEQAGLALSSELLKVAVAVRGSNKPGS